MTRNLTAERRNSRWNQIKKKMEAARVALSRQGFISRKMGTASEIHVLRYRGVDESGQQRLRSIHLGQDAEIIRLARELLATWQCKRWPERSPNPHVQSLWKELRQHSRSLARNDRKVFLAHFKVAAHDRMLDVIREQLEPDFKSEHGFGLEDSIAVMREIVEGARSPTGKQILPFVRLTHILEVAVEHFYELDTTTVSKMLAPWILTKEILDSEERVLWRSKQMNRILRRPMMLLPHETGDHLCFAKHFIEGAFNTVMHDLTFGVLPHEWRTPRFKVAVARAVRKIDRDWEKHVHAELLKRGLPGCCSLEKLSTLKGNRLIIPPEVGEIDLIHFDSGANALFVGEVKRIRPAYWNPEFADDLDKFRKPGDGYVSKLTTKVEWVAANWKTVCEHLARWSKARFALPKSRPNMKHAIVTDYQSIAEFLIEETHVISLEKLLQGFDATGTWLFAQMENGPL